MKRSDNMAVILVNPNIDLTTLIASATVNPGDVLLLEDGVYNQSVNISKNYLRIVARGRNAIFNGGNTLADAFILTNVQGVEIRGITIMDYTDDGIQLTAGFAHRILNNKIIRVGNRGIALIRSNSNFILRNQFAQASYGIRVETSDGNVIIQNKVSHCINDGIEVLPSNDTTNYFIGNFAEKCGGNGLEISGIGNFIWKNVAVGNSLNGLRAFFGNNNVVIENISKDNAGDAFMFSDVNGYMYNNVFENNSESGIDLSGDYNIILNNLIACNKDNGININAGADFNTISNNILRYNTPTQINNNGANNNFIDNTLINTDF